VNLASYTEDTLVQQTTAEYLEQQLGWESIYAYNNEDFGPDSLLGRASDREVVLTRILREKLVELNPDLPDEAYDDAVPLRARTVGAGRPLPPTGRRRSTNSIRSTGCGRPARRWWSARSRARWTSSASGTSTSPRNVRRNSAGDWIDDLVLERR